MAGGGGGVTAGGGGGAGLGGAVFVRNGASVTFLDGGFGSVGSNQAVAGSGGSGVAIGLSGRGIGGAIFLAGAATYSVSAGNTVAVGDDIGGGTNFQITGGFDKTGPGVLLLTGQNSYHRGHDDAWNIAAVLGELVNKLRA